MLSAMPYDGSNLNWENRRIHTANVVLGEALYRPGGSCGPRLQRDFELVILHSGACRVRVNDGARDLTPGKAYLFLPGGREHFQFSDHKETHHFWCSIRPDFMPKILRGRLCAAPFSAPCSELLRSIQSSAFKLRAVRTTSHFLIDQLGLCLFAEFLESASQADPAISDAVIHGFQHYVEEHFGDVDCLQAALKATGVSRNTLLYKLHSAMHTTPAAYLWKLRVERGAAMLAETGHTSAEIAYRCGFKSPHHFSRLLKQHQGQSPREFRKRAWTPKSMPSD
jgi:AraC-like DNA-binding protein